jgi:hypothetical protein
LDESENLAAVVRVSVLEDAVRKIRYLVIEGLSHFETLICFEIQLENLL